MPNQDYRPLFVSRYTGVTTSFLLVAQEIATHLIMYLIIVSKINIFKSLYLAIYIKHNPLIYCWLLFYSLG